MTKAPASPKRDLGPVFAIAAAAIAGIAVIAGFIIVGGPGHARDERLDDLTSQKIGQILGVAQCAFDASGIAPVDYASAAQTRSLPTPGSPPYACDNTGMRLTVGTGDTPAAPGDITYQDTGPAQIKICANFRVARPMEESRGYGGAYGGSWSIFTDAHPAGVHCQTIDLVRSVPPVEAAQPLPERLPEPVPSPVP